MKNITFLIGNGFDLNLGLKTRYTDMYEGYINLHSTDPDIKKLKELLRADAPGYETWGDFEMAMARHAQSYQNEDAFVKCVRDFRKYLIDYLTEQNAKFPKLCEETVNGTRACIQEFRESLQSFYLGQTPNVMNAIKQRISSVDGQKYNFIVFNYTTILDYIDTERRDRGGAYNTEITHIHGKIGSDIVLGIDNLDQLTDVPFSLTKKAERAFIKPHFNQEYDSARLKRAIEMIDNSDVICVYGMALGESDRMWIERLIRWLKSDQGNHLIYYAYSEKDYGGSYPDEIMDEEDEKKRELLTRICRDWADIQQVFGQVHIPLGHNIFNFAAKLKKAPPVVKTPESLANV